MLDKVRYLTMVFGFAATAKVLAAELPKLSGGNSHVLYPASVKASNDLGTMLHLIVTESKI